MKRISNHLHTGTYPAAIKLLYTSEGAPLDASLVTLLRFAIMAIASVSALGLSGRGLPSFNAPEEPWPDQLVKRIPSSLYACAIELGLLGFIGTLCNASGLQTVSALQGGIFLSFINVFTPTVSSFAGATEKERNVPSSIWIGSASALAVSAFALIPDDAQGSEAFSLSGALDTILTPGALLLLGAALSFSSAKVRLGAHLGAQDPEFLAVTRLVVQFLFALIGFLALDEPEAVGAAVNGFLHTGSSSSSSSGLADGQTNGLFAGAAAWASSVSSRQATLIVVSAIASGTGATWLQAQGQRQVPATEAQLIYSLTPIFSAMWAFLLLNEPISLHETAGGAGLIIVAYLTVGGGGRKQAER